MTARRFLESSLVALAPLFALAVLPRPALAQDATDQATEVENSKYQFAGVVNSNAVFVRSGPSENDYATMKLDKGAEVTVVGIRFNWLKIVPPEGSFCYVAKAYVNRAGNGSKGQVSITLNVRIGSELNPLKTKVAAKLEPGQTVEVLGEQDEYFKIRPPAGVYLYVNKQFVDPVRRVAAGVEQAKDAGAAAPQPGPAEAQPQAAPAAQPQADQAAAPGTVDEAAAGPADQAPLQVADASAPATAPATSQPAEQAQAEFDRIEALYGEASQKPLDEQPVEELLSGYQKLANGDGLPESLRRICDFKVNVLKTRAEAKAQFVAAKKVQESIKQKQVALQAERQELEERIKQSEVQFYAAVGTLRTSSLQAGQQTLYRLTDPANGRTVVYLRSDDPKLAQWLGQFIGVRGDTTTDSALNLRIVTPSSFEPVNPSKVGTGVAARIVPPSLLPAGGTASTAGDGAAEH